MQNFTKLSAAVHALSTVHQISDGISLERNRQAENGVSNYDFFTFKENNLVNFGLLTKKMPLTFDI